MQIEIGNMYPLVNPILPPRACDHTSQSHYDEIGLRHGTFKGSERFIEHYHQVMKRYARYCNNVKGCLKLSEIMACARAETTCDVISDDEDS